MSPRPHAALLFVLALAALTAPALAQTASSPDKATAEQTTIRIQLQADGDARWTIVETFSLDSDAEREAFRTLAGEFKRGETATLGLDAFRRANAAASEATDRTMRITNVNRTYAIENDTGRLVLSFTWTNFARTDGEQLVVGDAFNTTSGTWLPGLTENQTLVIEPPTDYGIRSSPPKAVENGTLRWQGPATFEPGYLRIVYTGTTTDTPPPTTETPTKGVIKYWPGGVVFVGLVLVVVYLSTQGRLTVPKESEAKTTTADEGTTTAEQPPETTAEEDADDGIDEELLSDEERVERLLDRNGGRMKQAAIVKETGWSNAKVSQLLSSMEEEGRIDKLRIGRENLISFPDEDVGEFDE